MGRCERGEGPTEVLEKVALLPEVADISLDHRVSLLHRNNTSAVCRARENT